MTTRRGPKPSGNFQLLRNEVARDGRLSFRALGLLVAMLSYPDDWHFTRETLAKFTEHDGLGSVRAGLAELEAVGYLKRNRHRDRTTGKWVWNWVLTDVLPVESSQVSPSACLPPMVRPPVVSQPTTERLSTKTVNEDELKCPAPFGRGRDFESRDSFPDPFEDERAEDNVAEFKDWRTEDREIFCAIVGDSITSDGSEGWRAGTWPADRWYEAFRTNPRKPLKWPGKFFEALEESGGVEEWLATRGLEAAA